MDRATLIGLVATCILMLTAIVLSGSIGSFVDPTAIVLVIGGTLLVTLMKFSFRQFANASVSEPDMSLSFSGSISENDDIRTKKHMSDPEPTPENAVRQHTV